MAADATTQDRYARDYEMSLYQNGSLFPRTTHARQDFIQPLVFRFVMPGNQRFRARNQETLLSFADSAGEDLVSLSKVALMARYLAAADAAIIMIDPLQLESVRRQIARPMALPDRPRAPYGPVESVERVTRMLAAVSKSDLVDKPIAVAISKVDALFDILPTDSSLRRPQQVLPEFDLADSDEVQDDAQSFLVSNGAGEIHRTLTHKYSRWKYFAVSALGAPPTKANALSQRQVTPYRIADPLLWILSEFDLLPQRRRT